MTQLPRIQTGIPGFDRITDGGLVPGSVNLISGGAGTGKTIFCLQYLYNGAELFGQRGMYVSFEETEQELQEDVENFGLDFRPLSQLVKFVYRQPFLISDFIATLKEDIGNFKPHRLVIDSTTTFNLAVEDDFERRKQLYLLRRILKQLNCTSLLISEDSNEGSALSESGGKNSKFESEEFLADAVIALHYSGIGGESDRAIQIIKMRQTNHQRGPQPMSITKKGIKITKSKF